MIPETRVWAVRYYTYDGGAYTRPKPHTIIRVTAPTRRLAALQVPKAPPGSWRTFFCLGPLQAEPKSHRQAGAEQGPCEAHRDRAIDRGASER